MAKRAKESGWSCWGGGRKGFPTFAVVILVVGIIWLLNDLKVFAFDLPWFPIVLIVVALGWVLDHYLKR